MERDREFGFAAAHDAPIPYLQRIRAYYEALGYGAPYEWAHYSWVPFRPLDKPLSECRVTIVTTAAPYQPDKGDQGPGAPYNAAAKFYSVYSGDTGEDHDLRISHVAIDRKHTTAEDPASYFPMTELREREASGASGPLRRAFMVFRPPQPSRDARGRLSRDRRPLQGRRCSTWRSWCPTARSATRASARGALLEENAVATIVAAVPRTSSSISACRVFVLRLPARQRRRPPAGLRASQALTLDLALNVTETAPAPRTTVQSPLIWSESPDWKLDYSKITPVA